MEGIFSALLGEVYLGKIVVLYLSHHYTRLPDGSIIALELTSLDPLVEPPCDSTSQSERTKSSANCLFWRTLMAPLAVV